MEPPGLGEPLTIKGMFLKIMYFIFFTLKRRITILVPTNVVEIVVSIKPM